MTKKAVLFSAIRYAESGDAVKDAGVNATALTWSEALGNDLNELRQKYGELNNGFFQIKRLGD
jgi:hypothetical protein